MFSSVAQSHGNFRFTLPWFLNFRFCSRLQNISSQAPEDLLGVLQRARLKQSVALLTGNRGYVGTALLRRCDTRLVLMGLQAAQRDALVKTYASVTGTDLRRCKPLLDTVREPCFCNCGISFRCLACLRCSVRVSLLTLHVSRSVIVL